MAAVAPAHFPESRIADNSERSTPLERTESTSSSVTIQAPLHQEQDGLASSSVSSFTAHSNSSYSAKRKDTSAMSSPPTTQSSTEIDHKQRTPKAQELPWEPPSEPHSNSYTSAQRERDHRDSKRWNRGYQVEEEDSYSIHEEDAPMSYPPFNEEEREARMIQQKLESWSAKEKQKRRELRASRAGSTKPPSSNRLSKRWSALGSLTGSRGRLAEESSASRVGETSTDELYGNAHDTDTSLDRRTSSSHYGDTMSSVDEDQSSREALGRDKGKGRDVSISMDPFQDPGHIPPKPRSGMPIVTPGRAATVRHRAVQQAEQSGEPHRAPAIVATDADEEQEAQAAIADLERIEDNPFQSADERSAERNRYVGATLVDGADATDMKDKRISSGSRFNEIGLTDHDTAHTPSLRRESETQLYEEPRRRPWWTEWLCGLGRADEDEEQSGRTFPE